MCLIATGLACEHQVIQEHESNNVAIVISPQIEFRSDSATIVQLTGQSSLNAVCRYYTNSKHKVSVIVDTSVDLVSTISAVEHMVRFKGVEIFDLANDGVVLENHDSLTFLYHAYALTGHKPFAQSAAELAVQQIPLTFSSADDLVANYVHDTALTGFAVSAVNRSLKAQKQIVEYDFNHRLTMSKRDVSTIEELDRDTLFQHSSTLALLAGAGAGKTSMILAPLAKCSNTVYISGLIALVEQFCRQTNSVSYREPSISRFRQAGRIGVVINSIWKEHIYARIHEAEVLIIDEFEKVVKTVVCSENSQSMQADLVFDMLCNVLAHVPKVLVADADLTDISLSFLKSIRGNVELIHCHHSPYSQMTASVGDSNGFLTSKALKTTLLKDKVMLFDCLKTMKETIVRLGYTNEKGLDCETAALNDGVLVVHADNKDMAAQSAFLADPNMEITKYRAILASPVLGVGFSITESFTDKVNVIAQGTLLPRELVNFARRFRTAKSIAFWTKNTAIKTKYVEEMALEQNLRQGKSSYQKMFEKQKYDLTCSLALSLKYTLERLGFKVSCLVSTQKEIKHNRYLTRAVASQINQQQIKTVINSRVITESEKLRWKSTNSNTSLMLAAVEKHDIQSNYGLEVLTAKDVEFHRQFDSKLFMHLPMMFNEAELKYRKIYSQEKEYVAQLVHTHFLNQCLFENDEMEAELSKVQLIDSVRSLNSVASKVNYQLPRHIQIPYLPVGGSSYKATTFTKSLLKSLGFEMTRYGGSTGIAKIRLSDYIKFYRRRIKNN